MQTMANTQRGASIWMVILIVGTLGFAAIFGLKLIPIYLESFKIEKAMKAVMENSDVQNMTKRAIVTAFVKRIDVDGVYRITERNFKEYGKITKKGAKVTMELDYDAVEPLGGNIFLTVVFSKSASN